MKVTVVNQRRWWSTVTKYPRSERKTNAPGWRRFTSLPTWKTWKYEKWRYPGVRILCGLPRRDQETWRSVEEACCTNCPFTYFDEVKNIFQLRLGVACIVCGVPWEGEGPRPELMSTHKRNHTHKYTCTYVYAYTHTHTHTYTDTLMHMHVQHTHIHLCTYTQHYTHT